MNYAYRVLGTETGNGQEKAVCKLRGITLNYNASRLVNFEVSWYMILGGTAVEEPTVVNIHTENKINRKWKGDGGHVSIVNEPKYKLYIISFFLESAIR